MWVAVRWCLLAVLSSCLPLRTDALPPSVPSTLAQTAKALVGATSLSPYAMGGPGFVRAALASQGIDPFDVPAAADERRSGVELIYQYAALHGRFHTRRTPFAGDLAFFGQTRDRDRDGQLDPLSHVGIVIDVDVQGTAHVAMGTLTRVVSLPMNLQVPHEGPPYNGRLLSALAPTPKPLGELFYTFARLTQ